MTAGSLTIGLEVHAQLATDHKLFCRCRSEYGSSPNSLVCPVCLGYPGTLPFLNPDALRLALRLAALLECRIAPRSIWVRKHYFYPDLPKGYQITQQHSPLASDGVLELPGGRTITITQMHLEEDAGQSVHFEDGTTGVDFNRAGRPLIEIVTAPHLQSAAEAETFLIELRSALRLSGVSRAEPAEGSMRCDANVSIGGGARVEIKNLNSMRFVRLAIEQEFRRQAERIACGETVERETRSWDERAGETKPLRSKEQVADYRYLDDPDLPPLDVSPEQVRQAHDDAPDQPQRVASDLSAQHQLREADVRRLMVRHPDWLRLLEQLVDRGAPAKRAVGLISSVLFEHLDRPDRLLDRAGDLDRIGRWLVEIESGVLVPKPVLAAIGAALASSQPFDALDESRWRRLGDPDEVLSCCRRVVDAHPRQREAYRQGKLALFDFFLGQVMNETSGRVDPTVARQTLQGLLDDEDA